MKLLGRITAFQARVLSLEPAREAPGSPASPDAAAAVVAQLARMQDYDAQPWRRSYDQFHGDRGSFAVLSKTALDSMKERFVNKAKTPSALTAEQVRDAAYKFFGTETEKTFYTALLQSYSIEQVNLHHNMLMAKELDADVLTATGRILFGENPMPVPLFSNRDSRLKALNLELIQAYEQFLHDPATGGGTKQRFSYFKPSEVAGGAYHLYGDSAKDGSGRVRVNAEEFQRQIASIEKSLKSIDRRLVALERPASRSPTRPDAVASTNPPRSQSPTQGSPQQRQGSPQRGRKKKPAGGKDDDDSDS
jgi:hypothetical protein